MMLNGFRKSIVELRQYQFHRPDSASLSVSCIARHNMNFAARGFCKDNPSTCSLPQQVLRLTSGLAYDLSASDGRFFCLRSFHRKTTISTPDNRTNRRFRRKTMQTMLVSHHYRSFPVETTITVRPVPWETSMGSALGMGHLALSGTSPPSAALPPSCRHPREKMPVG